MKQNENEIKGKELFELSLTFTEGDEEKQFSVTMKAKKDGKETSLDLFDSDFIEMSYNGVKMVLSQITYLYVKNLHDTGRMSDKEYNMPACTSRNATSCGPIFLSGSKMTG